LPFTQLFCHLRFSAVRFWCGGLKYDFKFYGFTFRVAVIPHGFHIHIHISRPWLNELLTAMIVICCSSGGGSKWNCFRPTTSCLHGTFWQTNRQFNKATCRQMTTVDTTSSRHISASAWIFAGVLPVFSFRPPNPCTCCIYFGTIFKLRTLTRKMFALCRN